MAAQSEVGLRPVRKDELATLKERLARHLPHSYAVHGAVSLAARYGLHALQPASILVPACPRPSCFTVIAGMPSATVRSVSIFWSVVEHSAKDVTQYLSLIPDLDWSQPVNIVSLPTILLPALQSLGSIGGRTVRFKTRLSAYVYSLQAPVTLDIELPQGYHLTRLKGEDASTVWTHWDNNQHVSEDSMRGDIVHFPTVGIRECGSHQLVSWTRTNIFGWMGNTFTMPQHRGRGLATVATVALARQLQQEGLLVYVIIVDANTAAKKFHERLGFRWQCAITMEVCMPIEDVDTDQLEHAD